MKRGAILAVLLAVSAIVMSIGVPGGNSTESSSDDWFTINKDYSSQRYVDLDQITPTNVNQLKEVCEIQLNEPTFFSSGLLKIGTTLYVNTYHYSYAIDATTCKLRWRKEIPIEKNPVTTNNSRGSAYIDGKLIRGTPDSHLIALDANTGTLLWDNGTAANQDAHESFISAPVAWDGRVFIGIGVGTLGIDGKLMAFDANTGNELWHFAITPTGKHGGGGLWTTYSLDPTTGEVFAGVGDPYPVFYRGGPDDPDNTALTDSVISVDTTAGTLNWSYKAVQDDTKDWDLAAAPTLYLTPTGRAMVAATGKSGRVYGIDRATQSLVFNTPATTLVNDQVPIGKNWMYVCPGLQGGAQFNGAAYNPTIDTLFVGMGDHCSWFFSDPTAPDAISGGGFWKDWAAAAKLEAPRGWITAIDGTTGAVLWKYHTESQVQAGLLPTASGLLFAGDTHGNLLIFNAKSGSLLRSINAGGAINDGLISYSVAGVQYVAVTIGGATENPSAVAGTLRVVIYGLGGNGKPNVVKLKRGPINLPDTPEGTALFFQNCSQCHNQNGEGASAPPILRQSQLADPELLKQFLATVPPPMPHLYPGVLTDNDVEQIADYLRTNVFLCGTPNQPQSCEPPPTLVSGGTPAWQAIYTDLTSPRCLNCHTVASPKLPMVYGYTQDYPRQGDDRHPHYYGVLRGNTTPFETAEGTGIVYPGIGTPFERCTFCHGSSNNPVTGIPGTTNPKLNPGQPFWSMAPASMAWESAPGIPLSGAQLCANLLNKKLNGNRDPKDLLSHIEDEPLVKWAFNPGIRPNGQPRTTPPINQQALIQAFEQWVAQGTPCPTD